MQCLENAIILQLMKYLKFLNPILQRSDIFQNMACHVRYGFVWVLVFEGMDGRLQKLDAKISAMACDEYMLIRKIMRVP